MLSTKEIIELYDNEEYDIIIDKLKIYIKPYHKSRCILKYALSTLNIELFTHTCTANNLDANILSGISRHDIFHPQFENILSADLIFRDEVKIIMNSSTYYYTIPFLKIILRYIRNVNDEYVKIFFRNSVYNNNIESIQYIIDYGYNFGLQFDEIITSNNNQYINTCTYEFLEENNIDIASHINEIGTIFCCNNNIDGIIFCLSRGANVNYLLKTIGTDTNLTTIKILIDNNADLNLFNIMNLMSETDLIDLDIIIFLVDNGIDISNYIDKLILHAINNAINSASVEHVIYFINMGVDIHIHDDIFLFFAVERNEIKIVKLLLDNGADIHARNNSILSFNKEKLRDYVTRFFMDSDGVDHIFINRLYFENNENKLDVFKYLVNNGAIISEPNDIHAYYKHTLHGSIDEEVLIYFLDLGCDLNRVINIGMNWKGEPEYVFSILEYMVWCGEIDAVRLFLKYGADPSRNNYKSILSAIKKNRSEIIPLLLDNAPLDILELVEKYNADKKLNY